MPQKLRAFLDFVPPRLKAKMVFDPQSRDVCEGVMIAIKRVYVAPGSSDGYRVLVDRLWPRGLTKEAAALDAWLKQIAPSPDLRRWFGHDPELWPEFQRRYRLELTAPQIAHDLAELRARALAGTVTLLFATRSEQQNSARVLQDVLSERHDP